MIGIYLITFNSIKDEDIGSVGNNDTTTTNDDSTATINNNNNNLAYCKDLFMNAVITIAPYQKNNYPITNPGKDHEKDNKSLNLG